MFFKKKSECNWTYNSRLGSVRCTHLGPYIINVHGARKATSDAYSIRFTIWATPHVWFSNQNEHAGQRQQGQTHGNSDECQAYLPRVRFPADCTARMIVITRKCRLGYGWKFPLSDNLVEEATAFVRNLYESCDKNRNDSGCSFRHLHIHMQRSSQWHCCVEQRLILLANLSQFQFKNRSAEWMNEWMCLNGNDVDEEAEHKTGFAQKQNLLAEWKSMRLMSETVLSSAFRFYVFRFFSPYLLMPRSFVHSVELKILNSLSAALITVFYSLQFCAFRIERFVIHIINSTKVSTLQSLSFNF